MLRENMRKSLLQKILLLSLLVVGCGGGYSDIDPMTFEDYQAVEAFDEYKEAQYDSFSETAMAEIREHEADQTLSAYESSKNCTYGCTHHPPGCDIKGNISYSTGEKIYHLPGQTFYSETQIDPSSGERWFCSEEDAIRNGWRKAYN